MTNPDDQMRKTTIEWKMDQLWCLYCDYLPIVDCKQTALSQSRPHTLKKKPQRGNIQRRRLTWYKRESHIFLVCHAGVCIGYAVT